MHENIFNGWFEKKLYNNHFSFAAQELVRKLLEIVQENLILNSFA
jgi:hypothetical protein